MNALRYLRWYDARKPSRRMIGLALASVFAAAVSLAPSASSHSSQWSGYARDAQHTAQSHGAGASQPLNRVIWSTPVDLAPHFVNGELLIHYGSPVITAANTVIVPVKTGAADGFRVDARRATDGTLRWSLATDYVPPPHYWTPVFGPVMTTLPNARVYFPGPGGTVYFRSQPDSAVCAHPKTCQGQRAFYGMAKYQSDRADYDAGVQIATPLTADPHGNIYFGFTVSQNPTSPLLDQHGKLLASGIARIGPGGGATWISAAEAADDPQTTQVVQNCAPALSNDFKKLYQATSDGRAGYLVALNSHTLARLKPIERVRLSDPKSGNDALLANDGSASPTLGPDGDVYYGVIESPCCAENHGRGWLLHFDGALAHLKTPGAFGWDTTASVVPLSEIPSYNGTSKYLLMTKYNNYAFYGGDELNKLAVLDPNVTETDPVTGVTVMNEVSTALGPTSNRNGPGVKEWCINSGAVDPLTNSVLANSEDGYLYRWRPSTEALSESIKLTSGVGEAYTPTVIGPDGTVYAINNATLFAVGK